MTSGISSPLEGVVRDCRLAFIGVGIFSVVMNFLMLTVPLYMLQIYDRVLATGSVDTLLALTAMALVALMLLSVLDSLRSRVATLSGHWLDSQLSGAALNGGIAITLHGGAQAGSQGLRDLASLRAYLSSPNIFPFFDTPFLFLFLAVIFLIHPILGWIAVAGSIILLVLGLLNEVVTRKLITEANTKSTEAFRVADLAIRNADTIAALGMAPNIVKRWYEEGENFLAQHKLASNRGAIITSLARFMRMAVQVAMLGGGASLVIIGDITGGMMIAASIIASRALAPAEQSIGSWRSFVTAQAAYRRVKKLIQLTTEPTTQMAFPKPEGRVSVEGLTYVAPGPSTPILNDISFSLDPGTSLGLVGPTSAGKTTLARQLVGSIYPSRGHVRLDGADLSSWGPEARRKYVGYLAQSVELFDGTVYENIARLGTSSDEEVIAAANLAGVHDMILSLPKGYGTDIGSAGVVLSAGQRQRIALARAVFGEPKLIVLDEPYSNLDSEGERALLETLDRLKKRGTTVVLVAHRPSIVSRVDKILVLRNGSLEKFGRRDDIVSRVRAPRLVAREGGSHGSTADAAPAAEEDVAETGLWAAGL